MYQVRDVTQVFATRPELMPVGETTQDHKKWQEEEAALIEKDRATTGRKGGLFRGCFRSSRRRRAAVIRDDEDGVDRCPECAWELEDGQCQSCGYPAREDMSSVGDYEDHARWDGMFYDRDGASMEDLLEAFGEDAPNFAFSEHGYTSEDVSSEGTVPQIRRRNGRNDVQPDRLQVHSDESDSHTDHVDGDSEYEAAGSLDGFVVEDDGVSVASSVRSLHWETDEATEGEGNGAQTSDHDQEHLDSQDEDGSNETAFTVDNYGPDDESDEGPVLRSRRHTRRSRSMESNHSNDSDDGSRGSGVSQALNALRMRSGWNGRRASTNRQRTIPHRSPDARRGRSTGGPIEIESDSDSPVPAQLARRRRRAVPSRLSSTNASDVEASNSTATGDGNISGIMSGSVGTRNANTRPASQTNNARSPIAIGSSPTRSADRQLAVPGAFPQSSRSTRPRSTINPYNPHSISSTSTRANGGENNNRRIASTRRSPANTSTSNGLQPCPGTRRRSPLPPRSYLRSPTPRHSPPSTAMESFESGRRDRQAQKNERRAERRRLKAERDQRGRPSNGLSLSSGSSNQYENHDPALL